MKRSLLCLFRVAFLILSVSACAPKPVTQIGMTWEAPKTDIAVQTDGAAKLADAPTTDVTTAAEGKLTPADALKLILLQLLVAR